MSQIYDPFDTQGQQRAKLESDERAKTNRQIEQDDWVWLMSGKRGRRIVWRLLGLTGVFRSSFTGNSETYFREGMRNIGLIVMARINESCPEQYANMVKEQQEHDRSIDADHGTN